MRDYILRRLLVLLPIMLGVSFFTFLAFRIIPADACVLKLGLGATQETIAACQKEHGLDRPWYEQYWDWVNGIPQGDLGRSLSESDLPVTTELDRRFPITLELMIMTIIFTTVLGIPLGVLSAIRPGSIYDMVARFVTILWLSVPGFYVGTLVIIFGFRWFGWSPPQFATGYTPFFDDPLTNLEQFIVPALVLALASAGLVMRLTRSSMLEVMRNDYIRTAWSKGLRERSVVWRHALKNALIPVVTVLGLEVGGLLGGAVIVETIFGLNGIGVYIIQSVIFRDILVVQTMAFLFAFIYVITNLLVDIAYAWLDPRIRYA
jgi:peptide/nickel transport system permease protein